VLKKMANCNTLTICSAKTPEYYLDLIRYHFKKIGDDPSKKVLCLQALGQSCNNLVFVVCLVTLKGYATYKRIKNDHISVPVTNPQTGQHLGLMKKVRMTVKILLSDNFQKIIQNEDLCAKKLLEATSSIRMTKHESNSGHSTTLSTQPSQRSIKEVPLAEESKFDKDDLVLKSSEDARDQLINYLSKDELALDFGDDIQNPVIEEDSNFQISHLLPEEEEVDEDCEEGQEEPQLEFFPDIDPILLMMGGAQKKKQTSDSSQINNSGSDPYLL
jgi:hypothetical protein